MPTHSPDKPTVSFIVPALDSEVTLPSCLDAILAVRNDIMQTEILLIDNGSTDSTTDIAQRRGVAVVSAPGMTVAGLRNLGARLATGQILAYVDADCVIASDWLEKSLPHFADSKVGAVGSPTEPPADATWVQRAWALHRQRNNRLQPVEWLPTENFLVRSSAFRDIGGFNPHLITCEDVDFCYRLGVRHTIVNDPAIRSTHLGEAPTLARFFTKEVWRGAGNLAGVLSHGFRLSELPSVLLPVYHLAAAVALVATLVLWPYSGHWIPVSAMGVMLLAPSLVLALRTAAQVHRKRSWPRFLLLYMTYAAARSIAILPGSPPTIRRRPQSAGVRWRR